MLTLLGTASLIVVYGSGIGTTLDRMDHYVGTKAKGIVNNKEDKRIKEANRTIEAIREYYNALDLEIKTRRHYRQLSEAQKAVAWERQFYGDAPLPSEVQQLEAVVQQAFAIPANVGKTPIVESPIIPTALKPEIVENGYPRKIHVYAEEEEEYPSYGPDGYRNHNEYKYEVSRHVDLHGGYDMNSLDHVVAALQADHITADQASYFAKRISERDVYGRQLHL